MYFANTLTAQTVDLSDKPAGYGLNVAANITNSRFDTTWRASRQRRLLGLKTRNTTTTNLTI
jgi:hypothetical protein